MRGFLFFTERETSTIEFDVVELNSELYSAWTARTECDSVLDYEGDIDNLIFKTLSHSATSARPSEKK